MSKTLQSLRSYNYVVIAMAAIFSIQTINAQSKKPNIIFIFGDDIGYETLTVNGGRSYSTPNLDKMAQQGMNFTQCQASPLCSPSRFLLLTGKYNFRNYTAWGILDTSQRTIANMFKDAGYITACFGKWQLDGGDVSIKKFGFDNYCVFNPFGDKMSRYKNPTIYTKGAYVPSNLTKGKYGEDIFTDSVINFIQRNKNNPFFIYYPMVLAHDPYQPTPDDADYANWNDTAKSDTSYYPSMIKYMDKKIGEIINKVKQLGIQNNTVIMYVGDNGSPKEISERVANDSIIHGGKSGTTLMGTHVPMVVYWPGTVAANTVNNDLIDLTDFLPTFADIAGIPKPTTFGALDGVSFAPRLKNNRGTPRDWTFYHYDPHPGQTKFYRWAQTETYKLYDTNVISQTRRFYNIQKDVLEKKPLSDASLTSDEKAIKQKLLNVITGYVAQGVPIFSKPILLNITDSSVVVKDTIEANGGSTITPSGVVWNTSLNPKITSSSHTSNGPEKGAMQATIKNLKAYTTYFVRIYAVNYAGTTYTKEISFKTLLPAPVATPATLISDNNFTAHWQAVSGADHYKLDVSTSSTFKSQSFVEGFNNVKVIGTSKSITGLKPGTNYYYRVRAADSSHHPSGNSNTITALTKQKQNTAAEANSLNRISVFPNPANAVATIVFKTDGQYRITVTSIAGKVLLNKTGVSDNEIKNVPIDISNFSKGIYLITVADGENKKQTVSLDKE